MNTAEIEVILDLRQYSQEVAGQAELTQLWSQIEPALAGRDMSVKPVHTLGHPNGDIRLTIAWINPGSNPVVHSGTRFQITSVLDPPKIRYRCQSCADYGPFSCRECDAQGKPARLCDRHVQILDGALIPTCTEHLPRCAECGGASTFRCVGRACHRERAHCAQHRVMHPYDPDHAYCPPCFAERFPRCEVSNCRNIGASPCEIADAGTGQCGIRVCAMHLRRWQVFGGEALGLGLCASHARALPTFPPEELIRLIVVGTLHRSLRRKDAESLPTLRGFAHSIRKKDPRRALDYSWIYQTLTWLETQWAADPGRSKLQRLLHERREGAEKNINRVRKSWRQEFKDIGDDTGRGAQLVELLRAFVRQTVRHDAEATAQALSLASYRPPRQVKGENKPGLLFVHLPEHFRRGFIGQGGANIRWFSEQLSLREAGGVTVRIEGDQRGGARR